MLRRPRGAWLIGLITNVVIAATAAWWLTTLHHSNPDCQTARAMIDYNKSQDQLLANAFNPEAGTQPSLGDYQNWANHLHDFAARITAPELASHAHKLADDAERMVTLVTQARADTSVLADPSAPPPWAQPYSELAEDFHSQLIALDESCVAR
jgi:hypothetical protein